MTRAILAFLVFVAGCRNIAAPLDGRAVTRVVSATAVLGNEHLDAAIVFEVENLTASVLSYDRSCSVEILGESGGVLSPVWIQGCMLQRFVGLLPGQTVADTVRVRTEIASPAGWQLPTIEGSYRLRLFIRSDRAAPLSVSDRTSNAFIFE